MKATIRLFGQFRTLAREPRLEVELAPDAQVQDAKSAIAKMLFGSTLGDEERSLLESSAMASSAEVLRADARLAPWVDSQGNLDLAILPPVCGG